jgi:hypothetical protein
MLEQQDSQPTSGEKATVTLPGVVEKIIKPVVPSQPEKAQISVEGADHLYREIRVENRLKDADGNEVALKPGVEVEVKIQAESHATKPASPPETTELGDHTRESHS